MLAYTPQGQYNDQSKKKIVHKILHRKKLKIEQRELH